MCCDIPYIVIDNKNKTHINMSLTSQIADKIWKRKTDLGSLSDVHNEFIRQGGNCSYETFRQFANELNTGSGKLLNELHEYLKQFEEEK